MTLLFGAITFDLETFLLSEKTLMSSTDEDLSIGEGIFTIGHQMAPQKNFLVKK